MMAPAKPALRREGERLGHKLPPLMVDADRVAVTVAQGLHGRRRSGVGETFWQYHRYQPGDPASAIDWRKSARTDHFLIRENEWEAANTVWIWVDQSASMAFRSHLARITKKDRAIVLALALANLLVRAGERVGSISGELSASASRIAVQRLAEQLFHDAGNSETHDFSLPPRIALPRFSNVVLFSDFLEPVDELAQRLSAIAGRDIAGHLVLLLDPAEETLPYRGRTEFLAAETGARFMVGRAEKLRKGYLARLADHKEQLYRLARRLGWTVTLHHTDGSPEHTLMSVYTTLAGRRVRRSALSSSQAKV